MVPIFIVYALLSKLTFKPVFLPYYDHCMVRLGFEKCCSHIVVIDLVMFAQNVLFFIPEHLLGVWGIFLNILYLSECLNIPLKNFKQARTLKTCDPVQNEIVRINELSTWP